MSYYEDEVPKSLELNGVYTEREIYLYMKEKDNVIFLCDSMRLSIDNHESKFKVTSVKEVFVHKTVDGLDSTYRIPNKKNTVIEIERSY